VQHQQTKLRALKRNANCAVASPPPPLPPPPPPPPPLTGTGGLHSTASIPIVGTPVGGATGFGSFWVRTGPEIFRVDASTNTVTADIQDLPSAPDNFFAPVATGEGAVWTSNISAGTVTRIDPTTNKVVQTIPVWPTNVCGLDPSTSCSNPIDIATTPGAVWVVLHHEWAVVRIDPATNKVVATIAVGSGPPEAGPQGITTSDGIVYVGGNDPNTGVRYLKRIDPATNAVTPVAQVPGANCDEKAAGGTHVWVAVDGCESNSIGDLDASSGTIVGSVGLGGPSFTVSIGPRIGVGG